MVPNLLPILLLSSLAPVIASMLSISTVRLPDGTPIHVRLVSVIDSERSQRGDPVPFVVTKDVVCDGMLLIERGTPVLGVVVKARRAHWGFVDHQAKLTFTFTRTTAGDGQEVRLRASAEPNKEDRVALERSPHHQMWWAGEADTFTAYVNGHYDIATAAGQARPAGERIR